ncbi:MAG TPA: sulfurtransferase TusA family protein, partial [Anaerolineales bacterium]|jgi:TusA-related sulfurtransferase|nr:sulfurtransferase TusA family protein [Anaerolineales bacterium]
MKKTVIAKTMDLCRLICLFPLMDALAALQKMTKGEILEVTMDQPLWLQKMPRNLARQGHKLISAQRIEGPKHRLLIEAFGQQ